MRTEATDASLMAPGRSRAAPSAGAHPTDAAPRTEKIVGPPTVRSGSTTPKQRCSGDQRPGRAGGLVGEVSERHVGGPRASLELALHEPTARGVASAYLRAVVAGRPSDATHDDPSTQGTLAAGHARQPAGEVEPDENGVARIGERFQHAQEAGDLPRDADPHLLARYLMTLSDGIAVEAGGGAGADELHVVADIALQAWPFR